jgi:hypothetical protein
MKNKIIFLTAALTLFSFTANTQSDGITFGLRAGFDMQNFNGKDRSGDKLEFSMVPRFNAGAVIGIPVADDFYVQTGLLFSTKGAKYEEQFFGMNYTTEYSLSYLELPMNLLYRPALGNGHILLGFGPYIAYGVAGKAKYNSSEEDIEFTKDYENTFPLHTNQFKPLDFGGNLLFGYELAMGLSFQINTQLGMAQINSDNRAYPTHKTSYKNTGFGLSLGYTF